MVEEVVCVEPMSTNEDVNVDIPGIAEERYGSKTARISFLLVWFSFTYSVVVSLGAIHKEWPA